MYAEIAADTSERETFLAVHLSDIHIDDDYLEGSLANCVEYLCCREYSGMPKHAGDIPAGKWGLRRSNTVYYKYLTVEENLVKITLTLRVSSESEAS